MHDGKDCRQTHRHEHNRTEGPPLWGAELRDHRDTGAAKANGTDHAPVQTLQGRETVEAIVDTGDEAAYDEADNTDIIKGVPHAGN